MRTAPALLILVSVYLVLGAVYVSKTPYREPGVLRHQGGIQVPDVGAPDERQHANYVKHLLDGKGFPVLVPGSPDLGETYQSHQPPLYYLLAAGWARVTGADPIGPSGARLRYLNVLLGGLTLFAVFLGAKWGLGREDVGLAAVALIGLMPMFTALHGAVGNDPLLFCLCTWVFALCARGIRSGWDWRTGLLCGVGAGLGLLTKTTALALLPTILVALVAAWRWTDKRPSLAVAALALVVPLVIGAPWMARNQKLYGDPFAIKAFNAAFVGSPRPQDVAIPSRIAAEDPVYVEAASKALDRDPGLQGRELIDQIYSEAGMSGAAKFDYWTNWVGWWTARSFVGVFGYMDVFLFDGERLAVSDLVYRLVLFVLTVLALASVLSLRGADGVLKGVVATGAALFVVVLLLFVRFNMQYFQGQARYLYPALSPVAMALGAGLCHVLGRQKGWAWAVGGVFMLVVQAMALSAVGAAFGPR